VIDTRHEFRSLFDLYVPIALGVFALVLVLVLFAVVRYRRRGDDVPRQRSSATVAELLYATMLAGVVALLAGRTFAVESRVDRIAARPALQVDVTASKWKWRFFYPRYRITEIGGDTRPARLVVPTGETVRFRMTSLDVIHSFFVPGLRFKRDAFPERTTTFDLVFDRPGFIGRCAEFCGLHHADMLFNVEALPPGDFAGWARERGRALEEER
jgi:cytochrome c oxidase subunit II